MKVAMKKLSLSVLALLLAVLFAACAAAPAASAAPAATEPPAPAEQATAEPDPTEEPTVEEPETAPDEAEDDGINLTILYEQDDAMINNYSVLAVSPAAPFADADGKAVADVYVNTVGAKALTDWLMGDEAAALIRDYGLAEYGEYLFYLKDGKPVSAAEIPAATEETKTVRLSTTTSVNDSGLLGYLLPAFEQQYGYTVEVASAGTGKAIAAAKMGNADLILVHSKSQEEAFVEEGYALVVEGYEAERLTFMYNYFVLVGPKDDPAQCAQAADVKAAFARIADGGYPFVSRGDQSGTHTKEISLWPESYGITAEADSVAAYTGWYAYSNAGMGVCLMMANETGAYILSDKATFLTFRYNQGAME